MEKRAKLLAVMAAAMFLSPSYALAEHKTSTDTGADILDFIENQRRWERDQALTEEQEKLLEDAQYIKDHLRKPLDPSKPMPTIFEGDDLMYDQNTGEFIAKGKVHIVQMDAHQFDTPEDGVVRGNTIEQEIEIPGRAHVLQMTQDQSRITMDGYNTFYRYGDKTGTMEEAVGKVDRQYVSGKRFEFYPDRVVVYDGTTTKCNAKNPDYHLSADRITIWPNDKMILENVKFWLKDTVIYQQAKKEQDIRPGAESPQYPRVGYSKDEGLWITQTFDRNLWKNVDASLRLYCSTKHGGRSNGELKWSNAGSTYRVLYGYYDDLDDNWVKRNPSFRYEYGNRIGNTPFSYTVDCEIGRWKRMKKDEPPVSSTHRYYRVGLSRDILALPGKWFVLCNGGYEIVQETYNDSTVKGFDWTLSTVKMFDDRWTAYTTFAYSAVNKGNSLFDYGVNDIGKALKAGFSYRFSDKDRVVCGIQYDVKNKTLKDVDYYWFHDIHCSQLILRYRAKRHSWQVRWEFIPW